MSDLEAYLLRSAGMHKSAMSITAPPPPIAVSEGIQPINSLPMPTAVSTTTKKKRKPKTDPLKELSLWQTWKSSNYDPVHLKPLQASIQPIIKSSVNQWKAANVPTDLIEMHANHLAIEALKSYDPNISGQGGKVRAVGSHVHEGMRRLQRFVVENQNTGRIQERRSGKKVRAFNEAKALLFTQLGRDPTAQELAEQMTIVLGENVTLKEAKLFTKESRKDRMISDENFSFMPTDTRLLIKLLPEELTPLENQVFERYYGVNGSLKMKPGQIALELKLSNSRVSRILNKISEKASEYL